jgi:hypothetical protein
LETGNKCAIKNTYHNADGWKRLQITTAIGLDDMRKIELVICSTM